MSQRYIGGLIYNPPGGWSGQFGATSTDMLSTTSSAAFAFGTGDFTMEAFVLATASQTDNWIIGLANNCWLRIGASGVLEFYNGVASSSIAAASAMPLNQWIHVAAVRSGTTLTIYQNGVSIASGTVSTNFSTSVACTVGNQSGYDRRWNGYISNVRVVKGTAVYTTAFTPPNGPLQNITNTSLLTCRYPTFVDGSNNAFTLTVSSSASVSTQNPFPLTTLPNPAQGGAGNGIFSMSQYQSLKQQNLWPTVDPYFKNTTLLLHGNGTNGGQNNTFQDSSTNNFTITRNGNTTQGTFSPFSQTGWGYYFNGDANSFMRFADSGSVLDLPGDFTIEFWTYQPALATLGTTANLFFTVDTLDRMQMYQDSSNVGFLLNGSSIITSSTKAALNTWAHYAVVRSGSTVTMYLNGTSIGSGTSSYSMTCSTIMLGGQDRGGSTAYHGCNAYISNFRIVKGTAVYTAAFTPPTAPLTAISGTSLLTCQSNRFVDNSGNALAVTPGSTPSVQAFSPFAPTAAYSASTVGGSGYFDGSGDYLTAPSNTALTTGTGNCTIEAWVYSAVSGPIVVDGSSGSVTAIYISNGGGNRGIFGAADYPTGGISDIITTSISVSTNTWTHVALVRSSGTFTVYINGVSGGTSANTTDSYQLRTIGGVIQSGTPLGLFSGYISDARIVKGTAVYTTAFTPPTAPLTNITNTSLLLNFTNAAIIDNTAKNDLETVGNAQISTTQSKFGGASLAFDGNGDGLYRPNTELLTFASGNFTIEFWLYFSSKTGYQTIVSMGYSPLAGGGSWILQTGNGDGKIIFYRNNGTSSTAIATDAGSTVNTGQWYHIAVVKNGSTTTIYRDGVSVGSGSDSNSYSTTGNFYVGGGSNTGFDNYYFNGYIDDLRITKGIARYTSNFTPQTSQWQDQ